MPQLILTTENGDTIALTAACAGCSGSGQRRFAGGNKVADCPTCHATGIVLTENAKAIKALWNNSSLR